MTNLPQNKLKQISLWIIAADFPVMYLAAVTFESTVLTLVALAFMALGAVAAAVAF
jgi:hypothetical protein